MFSSYFNGDYILNLGALLSVAISDRSDGKTFFCKRKVLEDYEINKHIGIYMRRFKTEFTQQLKESFFSNVIIIDEYKRFQKWEFKGNRNGVQVRINGGEWDWIVLFVPLSTASRLKSQLDGIYYRIKYIFYDEYVPLDNRYLPDEMLLLLEFYKSVDRDRNEVQILICGNRISLFLPILDYFSINLDITKEKLKLYKNNSIAVQIYVNKEHRENRKESKFQKLVENTSYDNYEQGGILKQLNIKMCNRDNADYWCSFKSELGTGSIWIKDEKVIVSLYERKDGYVLTDKVYDMEREQYTANYGKFPKLFKRIYFSGNLYFETERAYYVFNPILSKMGR